MGLSPQHQAFLVLLTGVTRRAAGYRDGGRGGTVPDSQGQEHKSQADGDKNESWEQRQQEWVTETHGEHRRTAPGVQQLVRHVVSRRQGVRCCKNTFSVSVCPVQYRGTHVYYKMISCYLKFHSEWRPLFSCGDPRPRAEATQKPSLFTPPGTGSSRSGGPMACSHLTSLASGQDRLLSLAGRLAFST